MSASESSTIIIARADASEGLGALREALWQVAKGLAAVGRGPHHLTGMTWTAPDPSAFHPARHLVDLAYREVFAGFRPPIELAVAEDSDLTIRAAYRDPPATPENLTFAGYSLAELARQYSPRLQADVRHVFQTWSDDGAAFRASRHGLDIAHGPGRFETLDLYRPVGIARPPLWVFIHGGYWQALDKSQHAQFAQGMLAAGYAVAMLNHTLAPDAPLERIVSEITAALRFLAVEADRLGFDRDRIHVAGHSAGGHLAAMLAASQSGVKIRSALLLSGVFDLAPLALLPMGQVLGLTDPATISRLSPADMRPQAGTRIALAVGGLESDEFKRQSRDLAEAWGARAPLIVDSAHHFSLLDGLIEGELLRLALDTASD
jgi:arylformamidase